MDLVNSVKSEQTELFEALQSDGSFTPWTRGRLAPVDRFLSNFHKPLQRRMMFTDPKVEMPASGVVRIKATNEILLIGDSRIDSKDDVMFDKLSVLHTVSNGAGGLTEYFNYETSTLDPTNVVANNIGKTSLGQIYLAVEFLSAKSEREGDEAYQSKLILFSPKNTPLKRNGTFTLNGISYVVVQPYYDSGFSCAHVIRQVDSMQAVKYKVIDEVLSGYDVVTGVNNYVYNDHTYPATVDKVTTNAKGRSTYNVYIDYETPVYPFIPMSDLVLEDGTKLRITNITQDNNTQGQWHLICEGS